MKRVLKVGISILFLIACMATLQSKDESSIIKTWWNRQWVEELSRGNYNYYKNSKFPITEIITDDSSVYIQAYNSDPHPISLTNSDDEGQYKIDGIIFADYAPYKNISPEEHIGFEKSQYYVNMKDDSIWLFIVQPNNHRDTLLFLSKFFDSSYINLESILSHEYSSIYCLYDSSNQVIQDSVVISKGFNIEKPIQLLSMELVDPKCYINTYETDINSGLSQNRILSYSKFRIKLKDESEEYYCRLLSNGDIKVYRIKQEINSSNLAYFLRRIKS